MADKKSKEEVATQDQGKKQEKIGRETGDHRMKAEGMEAQATPHTDQDSR